MTKQIC